MALRRRVDLLDDASVRILDVHAHVGPDDVPAVADRRVGDGHLERVGLEIALAHRQVDVVPLAPWAIGLMLLEELVAPGRCRQEALDLAGQVDPRGLADAKFGRPVVLGVGVVALVEHRADVVEEDVGGDLERLGEL